MSKENKCIAAYAKYLLQEEHLKKYIKKQLRKEELENEVKVDLKDTDWFHNLSKKNQQIVERAVDNIELEVQDE